MDQKKFCNRDSTITVVISTAMFHNDTNKNEMWDSIASPTKMEYVVTGRQGQGLDLVLYSIKNIDKYKYLGVKVSVKGGCNNELNTEWQNYIK